MPGLASYPAADAFGEELGGALVGGAGEVGVDLERRGAAATVSEPPRDRAEVDAVEAALPKEIGKAQVSEGLT